MSFWGRRCIQLHTVYSYVAHSATCYAQHVMRNRVPKRPPKQVSKRTPVLRPLSGTGRFPPCFMGVFVGGSSGGSQNRARLGGRFGVVLEHVQNHQPIILDRQRTKRPPKRPPKQAPFGGPFWRPLSGTGRFPPCFMGVFVGGSSGGLKTGSRFGGRFGGRFGACAQQHNRQHA